MIISVVNRKGGTGKTTTAVNLAAAIAEKGYKVLLIDADPQGSVQTWQGLGKNDRFSVLHHPKPTFHKDIDSLSGTYKHTVIDAPPAFDEIIRSILMASSLAIVPIGPSQLDIWSSVDMIDLLKQARKVNGRLRGRLLVCKKIIGTNLSREIREALQRYRIGIFKSELGLRVAYVEAFTSGMSVLQYAPGGKAAREIRALASEIIK